MAQPLDAIRVLAAVIRRGDRILLGRRPAHKRHPGLWEFPGGKLEACESLLDAGRRELAEELGLNVVSIGETLFVCRDPGSPFLIEFVEVTADGDPVPIEHQEIRWLSLMEAHGLELAPADRAYVMHARAEAQGHMDADDLLK